MKTKLIFSLCMLGGLTLAILAMYLFQQPVLEQEALQMQTDALLESIEQGERAITLDKSVDKGKVDFYDQPDEVDVIPISFTVVNDEESIGSSDSTGNQISGLGVLEIPAIDLKMPVAYGAGESQLKVSAGWIPQTATIGSYGNAVIAGHRNYSYGSHFNRLGEVAVGDSIRYTTVDGEEMSFIVVETLEVLPSDPVAFEQKSDVQMLTLYTCTPVRTATHRLLVRATRVA